MLEVRGVIWSKAMKDEVSRRRYGNVFPLLGFNNYYVVFHSQLASSIPLFFLWFLKYFIRIRIQLGQWVLKCAGYSFPRTQNVVYLLNLLSIPLDHKIYYTKWMLWWTEIPHCFSPNETYLCVFMITHFLSLVNNYWNLWNNFPFSMNADWEIAKAIFYWAFTNLHKLVSSSSPSPTSFSCLFSYFLLCSCLRLLCDLSILRNNRKAKMPLLFLQIFIIPVKRTVNISSLILVKCKPLNVFLRYLYSIRRSMAKYMSINGI